MNNKIIMHINYCEQGQTIGETCKKAVAWGYDGVEFRNKRTAITEDMDSYLESIYKESQKYGLKNVMFGGGTPDVLNDNPKVIEETLEYCGNFYPKAREMFGFEVCNLFIGQLLNPSKNVEYGEYSKHGSFIAQTHHWERAKIGLMVLADIAEKNAFKFALETHPNFMHDSVESTMKLVNLGNSKNIGVNLDYINATVLPGDISIESALEKIGDRLYYVHLKNNIKLTGGNRIRVGLGDGEYNNRLILKKLIESGFTGPICLEAPRQGDREWFARQDLTYMKSLIKDLGDS